MEKVTVPCHEIELAIAEMAKLSPDQRTTILAGVKKMLQSRHVRLLTDKDDEILGWWKI